MPTTCAGPRALCTHAMLQIVLSAVVTASDNLSSWRTQCEPRFLELYNDRQSRYQSARSALPRERFRSSGPLLRSETGRRTSARSEEHTSELQSRGHLVC